MTNLLRIQPLSAILILLAALAFLPTADTVYAADAGEQVLSQQPETPNTFTEQETLAADEKSPDQAGKAKIFLPETKFDFGSVTQSKKLSHTFVVKNIGDAPLTLIKAKGS